VSDYVHLRPDRAKRLEAEERLQSQGLAPIPISRRQMLRLSAGSLLSLGLWPGAVPAAETDNAGNFRFLVVNDIHYLNERCGRFLERVSAKIKAGPKPEFCLLAGDVSDNGKSDELTPVKEFFQQLGLPLFTVPGNHDYLGQRDRTEYDKAFPERTNYHFEQAGWRFVGLDSTEGLKASGTRIQPATLQWLDETLPKLDKKAPLVVFTHFPMGEKVANRPLNAEAVLERLRKHNLRAVFGGHYHALTERQSGPTTLVTNRCCSISRGNHDGSKEKGYFLCETLDGTVAHSFVEVDVNGLAEEK
jgi:3',5'-cyclic AMP phosphodiesterase CpdA